MDRITRDTMALYKDQMFLTFAFAFRNVPMGILRIQISIY